jgi:8-oxo-dGTP pyrophosphatase MutT (NUDIX family)
MNSISLAKIKSKFEQPLILPEQSKQLESSAILILLRQQNQNLEMILTRRAFHLKNHPGQLSFAGGRQESNDDNLEQTAIREANEEIGLPSEQVEILGNFKGIETISGFWMTPIIGYTDYQGDWNIDANEVHSMFSIPLDWAMQQNRWRVEHGIFKGEKRNYLCAWWQGQLIWGATAQILNNMNRLLHS